MKFPVLIYHKLIDCEVNDKYSISANKFARHLTIFANLNKYLPIQDKKFAKLPPIVAENNPLIITFDDGYSSSYELAFPRLQDRGMSGIFFVVVTKIGQNGFLNWAQLHEMQRHGMSIQSHTMTHPYLSTLSKERLRHELATSKRELEDRLGREVNLLSLPFGDKSPSVLSAVREAAYRTVFTSDCRFAVPGRFEMPRINIPGYISDTKFEKIARMDVGVLLSWQCKQLGKLLLKNITHTACQRAYRTTSWNDTCS